MESKKINQLATELAPVLSDLTIIGDPTTGISKKITLSQMASLFTGTVEEYPNLASFPLVGTADTIYIALDTNIIYRWNTGTSAYVELSPNIVTSLVFSDANGFDGTISLVGSTATLTITTALTTGSVPFIGASGALSQDNANLFFDDTNNRLGINTNSPTTALDVFGSGIIGRINGTSTNNAFLGFSSAGTNKWSIGNVQSDHRFRIYSEANTSELVSVLQTGEFGIGIANPTTKLHIDGGASALIANLDANVSVAKSLSFRSDNSARINLEVSGTESGSNAGANLFIRTYTDAGSLIETPFQITRSTGITTVKTLNVFSASGVNAIIAGVQNQTNNPRFFVSANESTNTVNIFSSSSTGSDNLSIGVGGGTNLYIKSGGNISIGGTTITDSNILNLIGDSASVNIGLVLNNTNSTNAKIYGIQNVGKSLVFYDYSSNASRISIGNTGTVTVSGTLVAGASNGNIRLTGSTDGFLGVGVSDNKLYLADWTTTTKGLVINLSNGNVGIGTTSPNASISLEKAKAGSGVENLDMISCRLTGSSTIGDSMNIGFFNATNINIANIKGILGGENVAYGTLSFSTRNFYTDSLVEALRINARGRVIVNSSTDRAYSFQVNGDSNSYACEIRQSNNNANYDLLTLTHEATSGNRRMVIFNTGGYGTVGTIISTNSSTTYNTTSDYRLKEDLKDFDALDIMSKIKFYDFKWKIEDSRSTGVIAHELKEIVPYAVYGEKDGVDKDENPSYQGVDYSKLVAIQGKAIQQLEARIKQLESK
jgi:hypothetical protein